MSFENSTIIQLRQDDSIFRSKQNPDGTPVSSMENGDFECNINPVLIEEGDVLQMKSCFLDTIETSEGKIIIEEDEEDFVIIFYQYILNNDLTDKEFNEGKTLKTPQPDGKHYFICNTNPNATNSRVLTTFGVQTLPNQCSQFGNVVLVVSYTPAGQTTKEPRHTFNFQVPELFSGAGEPFFYTLNEANQIKYNSQFGFSIDADKNNIPALEDISLCECIDTGRTEDLLNNNENSVPSADGVVRTAYQFKIEFNIPAGSYDPNELSKLISDKVSGLRDDNSRYTNGNTAFLNSLITTNGQFNGVYKAQPNDKVFYVSEDGEDYYRYKANDYLSGTSQFGLEYDDGLGKFKFTIINSPFYADGTPQSAGNITIQAFQHGTAPATPDTLGNSATGNYFITNKNSGIVFSSLSPARVWKDKMGFDLTTLCVSQGTKINNYDDNLNLSMPSFTGNNAIQEGVNATGSYKGIDIIINKTNTGGQDANAQKPLESSQIKATSINQNIILAQKSITQQTFSYGYYMIQVDVDGVEQKLVSGKFYNNKIQGIISRYYSNASYTSAYTEGSIPFTYKGLPRLLTKFKVRILQPNGNLADDIGVDNSVILELIKNKPPTIQALPTPLQDFNEIKKSLDKKEDEKK